MKCLWECTLWDELVTQWTGQPSCDDLFSLALKVFYVKATVVKGIQKANTYADALVLKQERCK